MFAPEDEELGFGVLPSDKEFVNISRMIGTLPDQADLMRKKSTSL